MAEQSAAIKMAEVQKKITKTVNKKFSKTQPIEKPFFLDDGSMEKFENIVMAIFKAIVGLTYIPIVLIAGIIEGVEVGFLAGLKKVVSMYERFLK
jgi:hypothetical protein